MLPVSLSKRSRHPTPLLPVQSNVSSGVSAVTVPLALTRTPLRLSVTIPTSMFRHTSSTTQRRPAVSPSATFALATSRSRARTTSIKPTSLPATILHTLSRVTKWLTTLSRAVYSSSTVSGMLLNSTSTCPPKQSATSLTTTFSSTQ